MRILIVGAGVLGRLYGARLAAAGQEVVLLAPPGRSAPTNERLLLVDDATGDVIRASLPMVPRIEPTDGYDLAIVAVRAEHLDALLPALSAAKGIALFLFLNNHAAGADAIATAVGPDRFLLGFPGACGAPEGETIRFRLIPEQPTTIGEPDGSVSGRLRNVASLLRTAGFPVVMERKMDDWLRTHAVFVTAVAGAIAEGGGTASGLAVRPDLIRAFVRAIAQGFAALSSAGVAIRPRKLAILFGLPRWIPESYWRAFLARPEAELMFTAHARRAPEEMARLVGELRPLIPFDPAVRPELERLWRAVEQAAA
jgi:2-dehydropantoate 2-reductase